MGFLSVQSQNIHSELNQELKASLEFRILPNPVVSICELSILGNKDVLVEVFDITGDIIYRKENVKNRLKLYVSDWIQGSYIVRVTNEDTSIIKRLIKL